MDYAKIAEQVIQYVGGKKNIKSVAHCATRLRFQLRDNSLRNEEALSDLEGVKGVSYTVPVSDHFWFRHCKSGVCRSAEAVRHIRRAGI